MASAVHEIPIQASEAEGYSAFQHHACLCGIGAGKVVTVLEILRVYADAYAKASYALALINSRIEQMSDFREDAVMVARMRGHLSDLLDHCEYVLPMTAMKIKDVVAILDNLQNTSHWEQPTLIFLTAIAEIQSRLVDELKAGLFFGIPLQKAAFFSQSRDGWEEVIDRFPDSVSEIEEMGKCFALSRYAGAVFHSLLIVECGVLDLGAYIEVTDPKRGWDATCRKLKSLVDGGHSNLPSKFTGQFNFLEQTNQCIQAMKHAWRNKVNHIEGKLVVLGSDFAPDVAEEIMLASRAFMRRLATEMPE